jgi:nucleoid DNA-binding protein
MDRNCFNTDSSLKSVVNKVNNLHDLHELCKSNIKLANLDYAKYYHTNRREGPKYKEGDQVLVSMRNITTNQPSKKLDIKYSGPFTITKKVSEGVF